MKRLSFAVLPFLIAIVLLSSIMPGLSVAVYAASSYQTANQPLQVWFDSPTAITSGPCAYQLDVHAQTSSGLWITNLHWDFGDGSTLDLPFSAESLVSDVRTHIFAAAGTYSVSVVAYDSGGNTGSANQTLSNVTPGSCDPGVGDPFFLPSSPTVSGPTIAQTNSLTLQSGSNLYLYGFVTGGRLASMPFAYGSYQSATNAAGNIVAGLAYTPSDANSFSTQTSSYSTGGIGVSGYLGQVIPYFNSNTSPGASSVSVNFQVSTSNSLVVVFALGGDEQCLAVSGLTGFIQDATNQGTRSNAITIGHAVLGQGNYNVKETTSQCITGQNTNNAADLIGVFVFQPTTGTTSTSTSLTVGFKVVDVSGNPIADASLVDTGNPSISCTTDPTGSCSVNLPNPSSYTFSVSATGYQTKTQVLNLAGGGTVTLTLIQSQSSTNVCTQGATIPITPEPLIPGASGTATVTGALSGFSVKYFVCGPTSVTTQQWGEYTILIQLWKGNQLGMFYPATSITSGTILLSLDRRQGPDLGGVRYEGYYYYPPPELGTSGWQQIDITSVKNQQEIDQTALYGIIGLVPGIGTAAGFYETMAGLLGITGPTPPQPPSEFTTPNVYSVSEFPIMVNSNGVEQYRVVFDLNPHESGSTEVHLWSWIEVAGFSFGSSSASFETDFAIQGQ